MASQHPSISFILWQQTDKLLGHGDQVPDLDGDEIDGWPIFDLIRTRSIFTDITRSWRNHNSCGLQSHWEQPLHSWWRIEWDPVSFPRAGSAIWWLRASQSQITSTPWHYLDSSLWLMSLWHSFRSSLLIWHQCENHMLCYQSNCFCSYPSQGNVLDPHIKTEAAIHISKQIKQGHGIRNSWSALTGIRKTLKAKKSAHKKTREEKGSPANVIMFSGARDWQYA